jgi:non-specific serine/threonine protein kinase
MLFDQQFNTPKEEVRPALPKDFQHKFEIGFLFNFVSSKSTRFDLEPVLIFENNGKTEYRRISLNAEKGLAFLHMLDDDFYKQLLEFSDNKILEWMTRTGNKFIRNHSGSWAHASVSCKILENIIWIC